MFHADRVIIRLSCGQVQPSRLWKVQCDWVHLGKECCSRLIRRLWEGEGGGEIRAPLKTPVWKAKTFTVERRALQWRENDLLLKKGVARTKELSNGAPPVLDRFSSLFVCYLAAIGLKPVCGDRSSFFKWF